jgi:hypothetical protein
MEKEETTSDIIKNLEGLNQSWCCHYDNVADPTADDRKTAEVTTTTTTTTTTTPLDAAIQMLSKSSISTVQNVVPFLLSLIEKTFSTKSAAAAATTITTNEDVDPKVYKLKQIEWHVVLMLDLWSQCYPQNENDDAFVKIFVTAQQQQKQQQQQHTTKKENSTDKRKKKKKRSKNENIVSTQDDQPVDPKQQRTVLLDHLVDILSKSPYSLPTEIPLQDFITKQCLKEEKYWKKLPNVVTYICDTFEILNPYVQDDENDSSTTRLSYLSEGRFSFVDDKKATSKRKQVVDPKKLQQQRKRDRDEKETLQKMQQQQQKKKQRLLASLKQNRFQTTKNRMTTHFNSNINDISKLLDSTKRMNTTSKSGKKNDNVQNNDGRKIGDTTTKQQQQQQQQPLKRKASTLDGVKTNNQQSNTQQKHNKVTATDPSLRPPSTKATATAAEETPVKSRHKKLSSSSQHVSWSGHQSNNDLDNDALMTPNDVTIGTTASSTNNIGIAANLHLPDKIMLTLNATATGGGGGGGVVEETPAFTRSRSLVEETPTRTTRGTGSKDAAKSSFLDSLDVVSQNHHNHDDDVDVVEEGRMAPPAHKATTTTTSGTAPAQPTKLFGVLKSQNKRCGNNRMNNNYQRATFGQSNTRGGNSTNNNNKPAPTSAVQIARALLRRRSM